MIVANFFHFIQSLVWLGDHSIPQMYICWSKGLPETTNKVSRPLFNNHSHSFAIFIVLCRSFPGIKTWLVLLAVFAIMSHGLFHVIRAECSKLPFQNCLLQILQECICVPLPKCCVIWIPPLSIMSPSGMHHCPGNVSGYLSYLTWLILHCTTRCIICKRYPWVFRCKLTQEKHRGCCHLNQFCRNDVWGL